MRALLSIPLRKYKEPEENSNKLSPPHLPATGPHVHHLICYYEWTRSQWRPISPPIALRPIISPQILSLKLCFPLSWSIVSIWTCYLKNILTVYISNVLLIPHSSIYLLARAVSWKSCLYWLSSVLVLFPFIFSYSTPIKYSLTNLPKLFLTRSLPIVKPYGQSPILILPGPISSICHSSLFLPGNTFFSCLLGYLTGCSFSASSTSSSSKCWKALELSP